ncbi:MAG: NADH-quinone oxidoreductase subunit L [Bacteroidetes bacterium]|nr:NADH-quinone oxidoreductase subunit L [Bacteroidota bacterium]
MVNYINYTSLILIFPLIGFLINGVFGSKLKSEKLIGSISVLGVSIPFFISSLILIQMLSSNIDERLYIVNLFSWIDVGSLKINVSYLIDELSIIMTLIVTGVGALIHIYAIGYMHGDKSFWRFFAYLNLFIFAMLNLVLADNFLLMFLGWEGVGLCSYLLIGFWYDRNFDKSTTADAAKKAFIVNRIGDFGFLIALFLIFTNFGSLEFVDVITQASVLQSGDELLTAITLLLFLGATGKSAQIPLFVWLPDAMAGPTPVSALIHAATMVTAGVYLLARTSAIFILAPFTMNVVAIIGITTAIFAGTIGLVQNDIKKVLAYSTISQLGYMFLACGVGAFSAAIFHLMTHAFFKALLFLAAGSVIHALHHEQDIYKMGGLKKYLPITFFTFLIAALAISGIPPLSGFFSKDEILYKAFSFGSFWYWFFGFIGAGLTTLYMMRLVYLTFYGNENFDDSIKPHESPKVMTIPLIVLAILSAIGGLIGIPHALGGTNYFEEFLEPVFKTSNSQLPFVFENITTEYLLMALSVAISICAIWYARNLFLQNLKKSELIKNKFSSAHNILVNKYFVDEFYEKIFINPIKKLSDSFLWKWFDIKIIDGLINNSAKFIQYLSSVLVKVQTGVTENYVQIFVLGVTLILLKIIL